MKYVLYSVFGFLIAAPLFAQWEPTTRLTHCSSALLANTWSISASFGGIVHVVWYDTRSENTQIYYKRSQDYGITWADEICLTNTTGKAENPGVSIAGVMNPVTHIVWDDDRDGNKEIYYKRSTDWGVTWSEDIRLTNAPDSSVQSTIHGCVCCGADVRIVWVDKRNGNTDIYYKYSADNGITWSEDIQVTDNQSSQLNPSLAFCRSLVQVVWTDFRTGRAEIWGRRSTDCGITWQLENCLSDQTLYWAAFPTIAHVDSSLHLAWLAQADSTKDPHFDIFYKRTTDLGATWQPDIRLTNSNYDMADSFPYPSCAALRSVVHLVWVHPHDGIYYKRSTDNGITWEKDSCLVPLPGLDVWNPSLAIAGKYVHLVWYDNHHGTPDIYYKRNPTGNPIPFE